MNWPHVRSFQSRLCKVTDSTLQVDSQNDDQRPTYVSGEYRVANLCFPIGKVILQGTKEIAEQGPLRGHFMVPVKTHMLNKVMLIGYVGADSEMKFTPGGIPVANFSLAVKETYKNGDGEKKTNTLWIRCVAWRRWAEIVGEHVTRGKFLSKAFDKNFYHQQLFIERNASEISN